MLLLPMAQLAYNSLKASITGISPFRANYGFQPITVYKPKKLQAITQKTVIKILNLTQLHEELNKKIEFLNHRSFYYYNKYKLEGPNLRKKDHVYLLRKNLKTKRPNDKLDYKKFGPFFIKRYIKNTSYKLQLLSNIKIHLIFHILLLEPAPEGAPERLLPEINPGTQEQKYEVEAILTHRKIRKKDQYLVKWKDYLNEENT